MDRRLTLIDKLSAEHILLGHEFVELISSRDDTTSQYLFAKSVEVREKYYGKDVYIRGLIEISSYCRNDCLYCGLRRSNRAAERYRLTKDDILNCCDLGYDLGFRTFVMQGGEDMSFTDTVLVDIISSIKKKYPDCAITLSLGERKKESYRALFDAGADRYLLRHETANEAHYSYLHPKEMSLRNRKQCLFDLKNIGYQTGTGFMINSPHQTYESLAEDLLFIHELQPEMVGIGPFIPHHETPFAKEKGGTVELTLFMLAILRLMLPKVLLPATTALGSINEQGRNLAIMVGANVIMPNLSPVDVRHKYMIYDNKLISGSEASESLALLKKQMQDIGYRIVISRGDYIK